MSDPITISSIATISALGFEGKEVWDNYMEDRHFLEEHIFSNKITSVSQLPEILDGKVAVLRKNQSKYRNLDRSVLLGILASRKAIELSQWETSSRIGINMGSSRGATELLERHMSEFIETTRTSVLASPTTTLGNISSWIAHDLGSNGPTISHSITCSTSLHALLNGFVWLKSKMVDKFIIGGAEAPLTPFTIAQMRALKIYSSDIKTEYPCKSLDLRKKYNTMVLAEGAGAACLERGVSKRSLAIIEGIGYATEPLTHSTSLSADAKCIQDSMSMALHGIDKSTVDCIVTHTPGTVKGDVAEYNAIKQVFGPTNMPPLTSNKWKVGHSFGASGILSLEMALMMLQHNTFIEVPYLDYSSTPKQLDRILVNAVGFGGNAVSVLLKAI